MNCVFHLPWRRWEEGEKEKPIPAIMTCLIKFLFLVSRAPSFAFLFFCCAFYNEDCLSDGSRDTNMRQAAKRRNSVEGKLKAQESLL